MSARSQVARRDAGRLALWAWALGLGLLAIAVKQGFFVAVDRQVAQGLANIRQPHLDAAVRIVTWFGSGPWTLLVVAGMGAWWLARGRRRTWRIFVGTGLSALALQIVLRLWVGQWRPDALGVPSQLDLLTRHELAGFPSGHAFRAAFLYGWWSDALIHRRTRWASAAAVGCAALTVVVGFTRVYLGRHWFSDVVGGWVVAGMALAVAHYLTEYS